jgi:manganese efflux pump family protein
LSFAEIFLIALGLSLDAFAVAMGVGASGKGQGRRAAFRISFHFGLFQFLMPVLGWILGELIESAFETVDHWAAFLILLFIGARMIHGGIRPHEDSVEQNPTRGWTLVLLSLATSLDALAVGLSLGLLQVRIWYPAVVIGVVTASLSLLGLRMGAKLGEKFGKRMEVVGGVILILIGVRILISHVVA